MLTAEFDAMVSILLRGGNVKPVRCNVRKAQATPLQWAQNLMYQRADYAANIKKERARRKAARDRLRALRLEGGGE